MSTRPSRSIWKPELAVLTLLSAATHLWRVTFPPAVVFDEFYYIRQAGHYLAGTYYFDVHPPLGKLLYALEAKVFGLSATSLLVPQPAPLLRFLPGICGLLVVPLAYILLRQAGALRRTAILGAGALLLENALTVDSRLVLLEPLFICFAMTAVACFLASRPRSGGDRIAFVAFAALFAGMALSVKWTGASGLGIILALAALDALRSRATIWRAAGEGATIVVIAGGVYCATFAVHLSLLRHTGDDNAAMSREFRETLIGNPVYDPTAKMSFAAKLAELQHEMIVSNGSLVGTTHPAASPWYTWPIMKHPIALWEETGSPRRNIILLGNPVVWWAGLIAAVLFLIFLARRRDVPEARRFGLALMGGAFLMNYVPFIGITRLMYLYHYLFALVWLTLFGALVVELFAWSDMKDDLRLSSRSAAIGGAFAVLVVAGFVYFAPFTYGWPLSEGAYDARFEVLHPGS